MLSYKAVHSPSFTDFSWRAMSSAAVAYPFITLTIDCIALTIYALTRRGIEEKAYTLPVVCYSKLKQIHPEMVRPILFLLGYLVWLVDGQARVCPRVSGQPGCVCQHPDGVINLTEIANNTGSPRYIVTLMEPNCLICNCMPCACISAMQQLK